MEFLGKHKKAFIITMVVFCIGMALISIKYREKPTILEDGAGYVVAPLQKYSTAIGSWFSQKINFLTNIAETERENKTLKEELAAIKAENDRLRLVEEENLRLSALLEISQKHPNYPKVGANIIAKDAGNWYDTFIIDKGSNDGLQKNMAVLASGGLVGRIIESGATYSKVISLIDDTSSVSAKSIRTNDIGIVKGDMTLMNEGLCRMEYIEISAELLAGDELVTSHLSDIYPPGLPIGLVTSVSTDPKGFTKHAIVKPFVDFKHMEEVLVITEVFLPLDEKLEKE